MIIAITFPTSAVFWLNYNSKVNQNNISLKIREPINLPESYDFRLCISDAERIADAFDLPKPISVVSPSAGIRYNNKSVMTAIRHKSYPEKAFVELDSGFILSGGEQCRILMATPEMTFLQASACLNKQESVILGCELCGTYVYDKNAELGQRQRPAITSSESIKKFLEANAACKGIKKAKSASFYLMDKANSRIEVFLAVLSKFSFVMGGYNLKPCRLNDSPVLSDEGKQILGKRNMFCDIIWEEDKVAVEYDSDLTHLSSEQHMLDKKRANALQVSGYKVISITKNDLATLNNLDQTFRMIRNALGMRSHDEVFENNKKARRELISVFRKFLSNKLETYLK